MKGHPNSGWHPGAVVVVCSGRRRRVLQYGGHDDVPQSPRGHLVAHSLQGEQPGARDLLRQRNRVAVGKNGVLGAVYDQRRSTYLSKLLPPAISCVHDVVVGHARGEVGGAIEDAGCNLTLGRFVEGERARYRTLTFDYVVDHGAPIRPVALRRLFVAEGGLVELIRPLLKVGIALTSGGTRRD